MNFCKYFFQVFGIELAISLHLKYSLSLPTYHYLITYHYLSMLSVFSKFWHGARNPYEVVHDRAGFPGKKILPQKLGKWTKNGPKTGFFEFIEKLGHLFVLDLFYNENLYYLLCSCTNTIFGKIFVSEIWAKMSSAYQIAGFFNQPYLQNKSMK